MICVLKTYCNHNTYFIIFRYIENFSSLLYIKATHFMHNQSLVKCFKKHVLICCLLNHENEAYLGFHCQNRFFLLLHK